MRDTLWCDRFWLVGLVLAIDSSVCWAWTTYPTDCLVLEEKGPGGRGSIARLVIPAIGDGTG